MELHCEAITITNGDEKKNELNPSATEFRPKQTAAEIAEMMVAFDNAYEILFVNKHGLFKLY